MKTLALLEGSLPFLLSLASAKPDVDLKSCLRSAVGGDRSRVSYPGDYLYGYKDVNRYNLYYDITPAAVVYVSSAQEVGAAVQCASQASLKVQARSGGHSYGDYCLGGISGAVVLDMRHLNSVSYDSTHQTATIGPGILLKELDNALLKYGRVAVHGSAPQVGVGGHFTIGGLGPLSRQYGTATDQILSAQVVLANGSTVTAAPTQNQDLFFALRGAGASFGVVTSFVIKTIEAPSTAVTYTYNVTSGKAKLQSDAFKAWQKLVSQPNLPRKLATDFVALEGAATVVTGTFYGGKPEFDTLNISSQLPSGGVYKTSVIDGAVGVVGQTLTNTALELGGDVPAHFYSKSLAFTAQTLMSDATVDALFAYLTSADTSGLIWFVIFDAEGGAINDIPSTATAYPFRETLYFLQSYTVDITGTNLAKVRAFLDGVNNVIQSRVPGVDGAYPGYVDPFLQNAQSRYWRGNLPRLEKIKAQVDPNNVFANPQSVQGAK